MHINNNLFYSGTSGLALPVPKALYPAAFKDKSRLIYYASLFNSVEINSSFYQTPMASTVIKWADSVPDEFQFTFKLSKAITHVKGLLFDRKDIDYFMQTIAHAGNKKGCLLAQFPPALKIETINQLKELLIAIKETDEKEGWRLAVEFRHRSWYDEDVYGLLNQYNVSMVIHDLPASAAPVISLKADCMYLRFHGPGGRYRGSYADEFLHEQAQHIKAWINNKKTVYCYFNNTMGDAVKNLITLNNFLLS